MEEKELKGGFEFKDFLRMWGQTAGLFGLGALFAIGVFSVILGLVTLLKVAGLLVGSIIFFVLASLAVTIWGWKQGERP